MVCSYADANKLSFWYIGNVPALFSMGRVRLALYLILQAEYKIFSRSFILLIPPIHKLH